MATLHTAIAVNPRTRDIFHLLMADGRHFPELLDQYFEEFLAPAIGRLREYLARGIERGEFRQTGLVRFLKSWSLQRCLPMFGQLFSATESLSITPISCGPI